MDRDLNNTAISARNELGSNCDVGTKLRALYTSIQEEAIPKRFLDLLEKLDAAEQKYQSKDNNSGSI